MGTEQTPAPRRKRAQKIVLQPREYKVGTDIPAELYQSWVIHIADWFSERKPGLKKPVETAKRYVDACLKGVRPTDPTQIWSGAEFSTLEKRIRQACRFDVATMKPIYSKIDRARARKAKTQERLNTERKSRQVDPHLPEEVRVLGRKQATYGDDPAVFLSRKEHERWQELKAEYIRQFPELQAVSAEAELHFLLDLVVLSERQRIKMLSGEKVDTRAFQQVVDTIDRIKNTLGIHPNQLAKRVQERREGSFSELLARYESMPDWREVRDGHWIEELLQLYQMYHQPSPRGDMEGYQLDKVGLLGMTGCMTCACASCGTRNYAGLKIDEIERYLEQKQVLEVDREPSPDPSLEVSPEQDPADAEAFRAELREAFTEYGMLPAVQPEVDA